MPLPDKAGPATNGIARSVLDTHSSVDILANPALHKPAFLDAARRGDIFTIAALLTHANEKISKTKRFSLTREKPSTPSTLLLAEDKTGQTPLHLAIDGQHMEVIKQLVTAAKTHKDLSMKTLLTQKDKANLTPLFHAAKHGAIDMIWLLTSPVQTEIREVLLAVASAGYNELQFMTARQAWTNAMAQQLRKAMNSTQEKEIGTLLKTIRQRTLTNGLCHLMFMTGNPQHQPLLDAIKHNKEDTAKQLLSEAITPDNTALYDVYNTLDGNDRGILLSAIHTENARIVTLILETIPPHIEQKKHDKLFLQKDTQGNTSLCAICASQKVAALTRFTIAARLLNAVKGNAQLTQSLLTTANEAGWLPIHYAIVREDESTIQHLLDAASFQGPVVLNAMLTAENAAGETAGKLAHTVTLSETLTKKLNPYRYVTTHGRHMQFPDTSTKPVRQPLEDVPTEDITNGW